MTDRQKSSQPLCRQVARSLAHSLHLSFSLTGFFTLIFASYFCCTLFLFCCCFLYFAALFFGFLALRRVLCPAVTRLLPLTLPFLAPSSPSYDLILLPPPSPLSLLLATYFVRCRRVLLVPRALLTLSLLPLTV